MVSLIIPELDDETLQSFTDTIDWKQVVDCSFLTGDEVDEFFKALDDPFNYDAISIELDALIKSSKENMSDNQSSIKTQLLELKHVIDQFEYHCDDLLSDVSPQTLLHHNLQVSSPSPTPL